MAQKPQPELDWFLVRDDLDPFALVAQPKKKSNPRPARNHPRQQTVEEKEKEELLANDSLGG